MLKYVFGLITMISAALCFEVGRYWGFDSVVAFGGVTVFVWCLVLAQMILKLDKRLAISALVVTAVSSAGVAGGFAHGVAEAHAGHWAMMYAGEMVASFVYGVMMLAAIAGVLASFVGTLISLFGAAFILNEYLCLK